MICLLSVRSTGGETEYLESVSSTSTTWTTDPNRAVHFLSEQMVPVTTVILRYPIANLYPLPEDAEQSKIVQRKRIVDWFREYAKLLPGELQ